MASDLSYRPVYTSEQISCYLTHVGLHTNNPEGGYPLSLTDGPPEMRNAAKLDFLKKLMKRQLATVPFENLSLHYSTHKTVTLDPQKVFQKIVGSNCGKGEGGRGGYCMENNVFFGTVLRSLGYEVYSVGAKVSEQVSTGAAQSKGKFSGW
jgi:N-acetyltransferase